MEGQFSPTNNKEHTMNSIDFYIKTKYSTQTLCADKKKKINEYRQGYSDGYNGITPPIVAPIRYFNGYAAGSLRKNK
jgi:hypothetical protein